MIVTRLLIGGALVVGSTHSAVTVEAAESSSSINRLIDVRPELGAILLVVALFLAFLVSEGHKSRQERIAGAAADEKDREERLQHEQLMRDALASREKEDREERTIARTECHNVAMGLAKTGAETSKVFAVATERLADAAERCAMDRDVLKEVLVKSADASQALADELAIRRQKANEKTS